MPLIGNGSKASQEPLCADEEQLKVDELRSGLGSLAGCALKFCSDACLVRYLKARNWHVKKSKKMLEETLKWRASFKPEKIRWDDVAEEGETGKVYRAEFVDKTGRTVLVLVPANQIAKHFLDRKTSEKVKFVYSNNTDSLKVMEEYFDVEKLYVTFGGRNSSTYNHEEHSKRMQQDDIKALTFWGSDQDS